MDLRDSKSMAELKAALIKQKTSSLPKPINDGYLMALYEMAQEYHRQITELVINIMNGKSVPDALPNHDKLSDMINEIKDGSASSLRYISQIQNSVADLENLLELALLVAEERDMDSNKPFVEIYQAQGQLDANMMVAFLGANGVEAFSSQESAGVTYGLTVGPLGVARIFVRREEAYKARELIQAMLEDRIDSNSDDGSRSDHDDDEEIEYKNL